MTDLSRVLKQKLMKRLLTFFFMTVFFAGIAHAEDTSYLEKYFKVEGLNAIADAHDGVLSFSATQSKFNSGHGHGWRNEAKIREDLRLPVGETHEHFSATITPHLPAWAKTIVTQYHFEGLNTALKVYVQDTGGGGTLDDGVPGNGVFDIVARISSADGHEGAYPLGTVRSGEPFDLKVNFNGGVVNVSVTTSKWGRKQTPDITLPDATNEVYLKFGDYLQAMNDKGQHTTDENEWQAYYKEHNIDNTRVDFSHVKFVRE
jgi:hypothetical protein